MSMFDISGAGRAAGCGLVLLLGLGAPGLGAAPASAQIAPISPRVQSFAGAASDGIACGAEALAANPAALARPCAGPTRMLLLPTLRVSLWSSAAFDPLLENLGDVTEPASAHAAVDPAARRAILDEIGSDGFEHRQRIDMPVMQFTGRNVSGSLTFTTTARGTVARDLAELVLEGHDGSRLGYSLADSRQELESYATLALGHGRSIGDYDVGLTAHFMIGAALTSWQALDPTVDVRGQRATADMVGMFAGDRALEGGIFDLGRPDGLGAGLGVGVSRDYGPFRFGAAVQNLVQWSAWSDELHTARYRVLVMPDDVRTGSVWYRYDPNDAFPAERQLAERFLDDAHFPRRLRLSGAWEAPRTSVGAGIVVSGDGRLDRDRAHMISVGAEHRPFNVLRVQTGAAASTDGLYSLSAGAGLRLRGFNMDAAISRILGDGKGYTLGVGLSLTYDR